MNLVDTCTLSEMFKPEPAQAVVDWFAAQARAAVFTSALTVAELLCGVELLPEGKRRTSVAALIEQTLAEDFAGRILPFDESAARLYGSLVAGRRARGRPIAQFDAMIAAIAHSRGAVVVTRKVADFADCGIGVINPWDS